MALPAVARNAGKRDRFSLQRLEGSPPECRRLSNSPLRAGHVSAVDFEICPDGQGVQEAGGSSGISTRSLVRVRQVLQAADLLELPAELFDREVVLTSTCWEHTVRAYAAPVGTPAPADALTPFSDRWIPLSGSAVLRHADD